MTIPTEGPFRYAGTQVSNIVLSDVLPGASANKHTSDGISALEFEAHIPTRRLR